MRKRMLLLTLSAVTAITMTGCAGKKDGEEVTTKPAVMAETSQVNTEKKEEVEVTTVTTIDEETEENSTEATSGEVEEDGYIEDHFADLYINGAQYKIDFNGYDGFYPCIASPTLDEICERSGLVVQTDTEGFVCGGYLDALPQTGAIRTGGLYDGIWIDPDMHVVTYVGEKAVTDLKVGDKILEINGNAYDENGSKVSFENGDDISYEAGDYREFVELAVSDVEREKIEEIEKYDGGGYLYKDVKLKVTDEDGKEAERTADIAEGSVPAGIYVGRNNGELKSIMIAGKEMENIASIGPMATGSTTREFMCGTYSEIEYDEEKREGKYKNTSINDAGNSLLTVWYDEDGVMEAMKIEVDKE